MNWKSTKFVHAMFVQVVSAIMVFTRHIDQSIWLSVTTIALGIYSLADVAQKKVEKDA